MPLNGHTNPLALVACSRHKEPMPHNNLIHNLDATGLRCPMPVLRARRMLDDMPAGDHLIVHASDRASWNDMAAFCKSTGHQLLRREDCGDYLLYEIVKK